MTKRAVCCVPFCGLQVPDSGPDDEGLCAKHWRLADGPIRRRYEAAWNEATAMESAGIVDVDTCKRVTAAWTDLEDLSVRSFVESRR